MVDETIDPFDLRQVMSAISTKFHPALDLIVVPDASVAPLDPGSSPPGIPHQMIIDATTPMAPDVRGHYSQPLDQPVDTDVWRQKLEEMIHGQAHDAERAGSRMPTMLHTSRQSRGPLTGGQCVGDAPVFHLLLLMAQHLAGLRHQGRITGRNFPHRPSQATVGKTDAHGAAAARQVLINTLPSIALRGAA